MRNEQEIPILYHRIKDNFLLKKKLGKGGFGVIYSAENIQTKEPLAVKFEKIKANSSSSNLLKEAKILHLIFRKGLLGFPKIVYFNKDSNYRFLVMSLLGPNLQKLLDRYGGSFSLASCLKIGIQLIERLKDLHELGYIHRDMKPENICVGLDQNSSMIYLIDFGLSKLYLDNNNNHIQIKERSGLVGTIRYTSVNSHLSIEQSRRDDLEALFYILVYIIKGKLPWQGLVVFDDETRMRKIAEMKCSITPEKLTEGLSSKMCTFFKYVKKLKFTDAPDYSYLTKLLIEVAEEKELKLEDHAFEWSAMRSSSSIHSATRSAIGVSTSNNEHAVGKKSDANSPTDNNYLATKARTINYLELPMGATPKGESESNTNNGPEGFNSRMVKIDSFTNIGSKEEMGIIKDLDLPKKLPQVESKVKDSGIKPMKSLSSRQVKLKLEGADDEDKDSSENYSQGAMDENVSCIGKKIEKTTLTTSKLINDINKGLVLKVKKKNMLV